MVCRVRRSQRPELVIADESDDIALGKATSRQASRYGRLGGIRTPNPQIRSLIAYVITGSQESSETLKQRRFLLAYPQIRCYK